MQNNTNQKGFSLLELLIVIAILALILATVLPSFTNFRRSSLLNTETMNIVTLVNRARLLSVSAKNDTHYGIHFEAGKVVLFDAAAAYSSTDPTNEVYNAPSGITISSIVVNGGGSDVLFDKITGETSNNATTTILVVGTTASSTLIVRPTGVVTIN